MIGKIVAVRRITVTLKVKDRASLSSQSCDVAKPTQLHHCNGGCIVTHICLYIIRVCFSSHITYMYTNRYRRFLLIHSLSSPANHNKQQKQSLGRVTTHWPCVHELKKKYGTRTHTTTLSTWYWRRATGTLALCALVCSFRVHRASCHTSVV